MTSAPAVPRTDPTGGAQPTGRRSWTVRAVSPILLVTAVVAGWGVVAAWWTPRGPVTTAQALIAMAVGLLLGIGAGLVIRSRWSMLLAPVTFMVVVELARIATDGPTVDGPHASTYGLLALATGRGMHGLLGLAPMVLGASLGATAARRRIVDAQQLTVGHVHRRAGSRLRAAITVVAATALVLLAVVIARPASTAPIVGADGQVVAGSVAELTRVDVNDHDLALMIRGESTTNPVLLFLAGGPGGTELGAMRNNGQQLEADFTVATLDQRGAGRSYDQIEPVSTLTLSGAVSDTVAVTNYLRERFNQDKVYLVGQSWGSLLGVLAAQQHPELFHAVIGSGQMVSIRETDVITYRDTLTWAQEKGDTGLVSRLTASGPPPYAGVLAYEPALSHMSALYPYDHSVNAEGAGEMSEGLGASEYSLLDKVHVFAGFLDTFAALYPQLQDIDLRVDVPLLEVPVYLFQGRFETPGRAVLAQEWFTALDAPAKQLTIADTSGHRSLWEQPAEFHTFMTNTVLGGAALQPGPST